MSTYAVEFTLEEDGALTLTGLPFRAGDRVKVLIERVAANRDEKYSLLGTVIRYDDPTEPVAVEDWEVLR